MIKRNVGTKIRYENGTILRAVEVDTFECNGCYFLGLPHHKCYERYRGKDAEKNAEVMYCGKGSRKGKFVIYKKW
jgi:hypothetical protein